MRRTRPPHCMVGPERRIPLFAVFAVKAKATEGCESGRIGTTGNRVWRKSPWVQIPLSPLVRRGAVPSEVPHLFRVGAKYGSQVARSTRRSFDTRHTGGVSVHWTIEVPDDVAERVAGVAAERGVAPEELAGEVVVEQFAERRKIGFIGIGHSGRGDLSRRVKELRREAFANKTARDA